MRAVVIYESMYGNTHAVADHIAVGLRPAFEVTVISVAGAADADLASADLLVVGGPTHAHGLTSAATRRSAADAAEKDHDLHLDPDAEGPGLRDLLSDLPGRDGAAAAAFDTRFDATPVLTGRASKGIARRLRHHDYRLVAEPESFLVDKENHLLDGEADRAERWGADLAATLQA